MLSRSVALVFALLVSAFPLASHHAWASGGGGGEKEQTALPFKYIPMTPPFVVNVGETGRVGFLKVEISLRAKTEAADAVEHHMPALRHELVMLLSRQKPETLEDATKREDIRLEALEAVRKVIEKEESIKGEDGVTDLLFTSFLMQR